ncbi:ParB/RepB/Spo0J family partition protein [Microbacterium sp. Root180]|uniref:ParB/RepB/Spo0J family partition protein n=1 Tax=Microbacterium sp. Root180 TaxID=1736483 RepID=UPI00138F2CA5|nr:ParB/RepB/Spo0J family partition protein [Microbacterium sp. Root180]
MRLIEIPPSELVVGDELRRSGSAKQFEERLRSSIEEIGLAEPIKVAPMPSGKFLVVDGTMRLRAINAIRESDDTAFDTVPAYLTDYERRYEIRFQTDIYQDLLPSQLAQLVEHLHESEGVKKADIARYIGVSPATLRNYTGLWRLVQRAGQFAKVVELMDAGVFPASNPYAWLRLTAGGLDLVLQQLAGDAKTPETWISEVTYATRQGHVTRYTTSEIESVTGALADAYYVSDSETRSAKKDLGTRRAMRAAPVERRRSKAAVKNLTRVSQHSTDPVLKAAATSFKVYLT